MPRYVYRCPKCGYFEATRGVEESFTPCSICGTPAKREPYSGVPYSKTETGGDFLPGTPMRER